MNDAATDAVQHVSSNGGHLHFRRRASEDEPRIRVGSLYQAVLPPFAPPVSPPPRPIARPVDDNDVAAAEARFGATELAGEQPAEEMGGQAIWLASRIKQSRTRQRSSATVTLDSYLQFVQTLFHKNQRYYCEERALYFLHQCDYGIPRAMKLLRPPPPAAAAPSLTADDDLYPADDFCFVCRDGGQLILCDQPGCRKVYHPPCVKLESVPQGTWHCPYHECSVCKRRVADDAGSRQCAHCPTAYCSEHVPSTSIINVVGEPLCPLCRQQEEEDSIDLLGRYSDRRAFVKRVQMTLKRDSRQLIRIPRMQGRPLNILSLYKEVRQRGGVAAVMVRLGWRGVMRALGLTVSDRSQHLLRRWYLSVLYAYEKHFFASFVPLTTTQSLSAQHANGEEEQLQQLDDASTPLGGAAAAKKRKRAREEQQQREQQEEEEAANDGLFEGDDEPDEVVVLIRNVPVTTAALPTSKKKRRRGTAKQEETMPTATIVNGSSNSSSSSRRRERSRADGIEVGTDDRVK